MSKYSEHTKLGWWLGFCSLLFEISLGLSYLFPGEDRKFAFITIAEGGFALLGLIFLDSIYGKPVQFYPDNFKRPETETIGRMAYILGAIVLIQAIMRFPLTVRKWDRGLAIMFAGPAEELFFRGVLLAPFIKFGINDIKLKIKSPFGKKKYLLEITPTELIGVLLSSMFFMLLHINYYGNTKLLIAVFLSGIFLGLFYIKYHDLTANILAHFILNFIVVMRSFWFVNF